MEKNIFLNLALKVLKEEKKPLSSREIWKIAVQKGYDKELNSEGKTPWDSLSGQLYTSTKSSVYFDKIGARPVRFVLKEHSQNINLEKITKEQIEKETTDNYKFDEKDLHPILAYFARVHLKAYLKTISHLTSKKNDKYAVWMHPDMVGCYFPFKEWGVETSCLSSEIGSLPVKLFSFELKKELNFSNLREYFFQAVSNSSWANESYIVTPFLDEEAEFKDELKRLSSAYGVGVIQLDIESPDSSKILFPAKEKENLDWDTINKISELNKDFKEFIKRITNDIKTKEVREEEFDRILDVEKLIIKG